MEFNYDKLWKLLIDKKLKKKDLIDLANLSPATIAKMTRNESVTLETLGRLCKVLKCNIGDLVDVKIKDSEVD